MNNTRWGKNWGTFERIDWCDDIDINTFFEYVSSLSFYLFPTVSPFLLSLPSPASLLTSKMLTSAIFLF
jgi:hypothetical protein